MAQRGHISEFGPQRKCLPAALPMARIDFVVI
jgi:hypothetical protein